VDGADPATAWDGYHTIDEVPYLFRPHAGWLHGMAGSPFAATAAGGGPDSTAYPPYMAATRDAPRTAWTRSVLGVDTAWTAALLGAAAFTGRVEVSQDLVRGLVDDWERAGVVDHTRVEPLDAPLDSLRAWDGLLGPESVTATYYILLAERLRAGAGAPGAPGAYPHLAALEAVLEELEAGHGTIEVPWGQVNRLQPPAPAGYENPPEYPMGGAPAWTGAAFVYDAARAPDAGGRYARGHTWMSVTAFAPTGVEAHTVVPFGQQGQPGAPHAGDQAPLYAEGRFKPRPFSTQAVLEAAVESYRPGERAAAGTGDAGETRPGIGT
jgi:acyl-homoserine-lactone acylase